MRPRYFACICAYHSVHLRTVVTPPLVANSPYPSSKIVQPYLPGGANVYTHKRFLEPTRSLATTNNSSRFFPFFLRFPSIRYIAIARPKKMPFLVRRSEPHLINRSDPPTQTASRSSQPYIQNPRSLPTDVQTDRQTERTRVSVGTNRPLI